MVVTPASQWHYINQQKQLLNRKNTPAFSVSIAVRKGEFCHTAVWQNHSKKIVVKPQPGTAAPFPIQTRQKPDTGASEDAKKQTATSYPSESASSWHLEC